MLLVFVFACAFAVEFFICKDFRLTLNFCFPPDLILCIISSFTTVLTFLLSSDLPQTYLGLAFGLTFVLLSGLSRPYSRSCLGLAFALSSACSLPCPRLAFSITLCLPLAFGVVLVFIFKIFYFNLEFACIYCYN